MKSKGMRSAGGVRPLPAGVVSPPDSARLRELTEALRDAGGGTLRALLLYGSHVQASEPDRFSAYDLIVVVDAYRPFYESLANAGRLRRPPWLMALVSHVLMPNVVSFDADRHDAAGAKCIVVTLSHLKRAAGPRAKDHFLKGRTVQRLALAWARSQADREKVLDALRLAREDTVRWVRPFRPAPFDAESYAETMLRVSYAAEIRPEAHERVREVFDAQRETLVAIARQAIAAALERGDATETPQGYAWTREAGAGSRWVISLYFTRSKARATARWFKYLITFEDWAPYIVRKLERRAGLHIEVTDRERRWPVLFLWPKLFWVLKELKRNSGTSGEGPSP